MEAHQVRIKEGGGRDLSISLLDISPHAHVQEPPDAHHKTSPSTGILICCSILSDRHHDRPSPLPTNISQIQAGIRRNPYASFSGPFRRPPSHISLTTLEHPPNNQPPRPFNLPPNLPPPNPHPHLQPYPSPFLLPLEIVPPHHRLLPHHRRCHHNPHPPR